MPPPANTPRGRRKRTDDRDLTAIGDRGRQTGLQVKEHGRDEYGMENVDEFFSSASKAATARTARSSRKSDQTLTSSQDMDIAVSPGPDVTEILNSRSAKRPSGLPPQSRSPIKTNLGATPRRPSSVGPRASIGTPKSRARQSSYGPIPPLDFSIGETRSVVRSVERSPHRSTPRQNGSGRNSNIYSLSPSPEKGRNASHLRQSYDAFEDEAEDTQQVNGGFDEASLPLPAVEDDTFGNVGEDEGDGDGAGEREESPPLAELEDEAAVAVEAIKAKGKNRKSLRRSDTSNASQASQAEIQDEATASAQPSRRGPGRPRKDAAKAPSKQAAKKSAPAKARQVGANKNVNARSKPEGNGFKKPGVPHGNVRIRRHDTPLEDDDTVHTRSGRLSYKPLQAWKGERAVYQPQDMNGAVTDSISEIIRMEDVTPQKRRYDYSRSSQQPRRKRRKNAAHGSDEDSDDAPEYEPWEVEDGVISGNVQLWDAELETGVDEHRHQEIAFAATKIEPRENGEGSFRFAKTLTMPFFGSGVVELPVGGFKRTKNSRRMQMMFFVHTGKVIVEVAGTKFGLSVGGVWQVPRGNFYSIRNEGQKTAKIFFSQGCEVEVEQTGLSSSQGNPLPAE